MIFICIIKIISDPQFFLLFFFFFVCIDFFFLYSFTNLDNLIKEKCLLNLKQMLLETGYDFDCLTKRSCCC